MTGNPKPETPASKKEAALAIAPPKFLVQLGEDLACDPDELKKTIFNTCMYEGATAEEFRTYLMIANKLELNPLNGEIYALKKKGGGIQAVVGKNGWNTILNRNAAVYDGRELSYWYEMADSKWQEFPQPIDGNLVMVTCKIFRKDRSRAEVAHAKYSEYYKETNYDSPWKKYLTTMMEHKAYNKSAAAAFGMADAIDADDAKEFCEIKSASSAAREDFKARGLVETPDGRLERDITPPAPDDPEMPKAGDTASEPVPARPRDNGVKQATARSYNYAKSMAIDDGGCPDDDTFKEFLEHKGIALPISHEDCSGLIEKFKAGDFDELHEFLGAGEDAVHDDPLDPGTDEDAPGIDEGRTELFNKILDLKIADPDIYYEAVGATEKIDNIHDMANEDLEIFLAKMLETQDKKEAQAKKKSKKK